MVPLQYFFSDTLISVIFVKIQMKIPVPRAENSYLSTAGTYDPITLLGALQRSALLSEEYVCA